MAARLPVDPAGTRTAVPTGPSHPSQVYSGNGVRFRLPPGWRVDDAAPAVMTRLQAPGAVMEVYVQDLRADLADARTYIEYGHRSVLKQWNGIRLLGDESATLAGKTARIVSWSRPALLRLQEDRRFYREIDLVESPRLVVTILLKATESEYVAAQRAQLDLARSVVPDGSPPRQQLPDPPAGRDWREWQGRTPLRWEVPESGLIWGIFDPLLAPGPTWNYAGFREYEKDLGVRFGVLMTYQSFGQPFPTAELEMAARDGRLVMLTLQSWHPVERERVYSEPLSLTLRILSGEFDEYLRTYAQAAREWGRPFFFRLDNEMNTDWVPWGAFQYGKDSELYRQAWRYVWEIFRAEGADNAIWVWNPNDTAFPNWKWNHHTVYWPGSRYVDWVGLTAYNLGNSNPGSRWRTFREAYGPPYDEYRRLYPGKPLMITEFASHSGPGDKAQWIRDMFEALKTDFREIKIAVWWNGTEGPRQYRLDSSPESRRAFVEGLRDPYFVNPIRFVGS
ncbi:beta-mannanase [Caldinitratiruptor microaerophilus]|uniref:Beta-mannanase n=1 Tax=Caldinitratiruptor microaerophilus TaxID=671077 RepID=A0AA35G9R9_9FIRM|nr:beta-mannanase [Caldinitratiruptor microaerophilus]